MKVCRGLESQLYLAPCLARHVFIKGQGATTHMQRPEDSLVGVSFLLLPCGTRGAGLVFQSLIYHRLPQTRSSSL